MWTNILIVLCYSIAVAICIIFPRKKSLPVPSNDYQTLIEILEECIKREITFKHKDYKLRDVKIIYDFEEDLTEIVQKIMMSFSDEYLNELYYYHPRRYIMTMVTRHVRDFLIRYSQENKIKTK